MSDERAQESTRVFITFMDVDQVGDIPFANIAGEGEAICCVSAPIDDPEELERLLRVPGYSIWDGDTDQVDSLIAARHVRTIEEKDEGSATIASLEDSNHRLSRDLVAARHTIGQMKEADRTGAQEKIEELVAELRVANERITALDAAGGDDDAVKAALEGANERVAEAEKKATDAAAEVDALKEKLAAASTGGAEAASKFQASLVTEIRRISELPQGFKKELVSLLEQLEGKPDEQATDPPQQGGQ